MWQRVLQHFSQAKQIFLAGTAFRFDQQPLRAVPIFTYSLEEALEDGVIRTPMTVLIEADQLSIRYEATIVAVLNMVQRLLHPKPPWWWPGCKLRLRGWCAWPHLGDAWQLCMEILPQDANVAVYDAFGVGAIRPWSIAGCSQKDLICLPSQWWLFSVATIMWVPPFCGALRINDDQQQQVAHLVGHAELDRDLLWDKLVEQAHQSQHHCTSDSDSNCDSMDESSDDDQDRDRGGHRQLQIGEEDDDGVCRKLEDQSH